MKSLHRLCGNALRVRTLALRVSLTLTPMTFGVESVAIGAGAAF
jgi:hypothetical protein